MPPPHRHAPPVPPVEVADDADPTRVGRPHGKRHALDPVVDDRVRTELAIAGEMVAFDQEMDVELPEHRREPIDILELVPMPATPADPQPIAERLGSLAQLGDEQP